MRIALLLVALMATGCIRTRVDPVTGKTDVDVESPMKKGEDWVGDLKGMGQWSNVSGVARARVIGGQSTISITIKGATPGAVHPWHLHDGTCASGGPIVGPPSAYTPLTIGSEGMAERSATITGTLNEAKKYHVNVHASASELSTIVACGDIKD